MRHDAHAPGASIFPGFPLATLTWRPASRKNSRYPGCSSRRTRLGRHWVRSARSGSTLGRPRPSRPKRGGTRVRAIARSSDVSRWLSRRRGTGSSSTCLCRPRSRSWARKNWSARMRAGSRRQIRRGAASGSTSLPGDQKLHGHAPGTRRRTGRISQPGEIADHILEFLADAVRMPASDCRTSPAPP
jgi:hypothetical protein